MSYFPPADFGALTKPFEMATRRGPLDLTKTLPNILAVDPRAPTKESPETDVITEAWGEAWAGLVNKEMRAREAFLRSLKGEDLQGEEFKVMLGRHLTQVFDDFGVDFEHLAVSLKNELNNNTSLTDEQRSLMVKYANALEHTSGVFMDLADQYRKAEKNGYQDIGMFNNLEYVSKVMDNLTNQYIRPFMNAFENAPPYVQRMFARMEEDMNNIKEGMQKYFDYLKENEPTTDVAGLQASLPAVTPSPAMPTAGLA